jgi:plasmid stability protein
MPAITIRDVPESTRDELASRAAGAGQSLQEYLRRHLIEVAEGPDRTAVLARIAERKRRTASTLDVETILELIDDGRK